MPARLEGGCMCGSVRYSVALEPKPMFEALCHCADCQRWSGTAFVSAMFVPKQVLKLEGVLRYFAHKGGTGHDLERGFCPDCGSHIVIRTTKRDGIAVMAGTLDDPSQFSPTMNVFCRSARDHVWETDALTKFAGPPEF